MNSSNSMKPTAVPGNVNFDVIFSSDQNIEVLKSKAADLFESPVNKSVLIQNLTAKQFNECFGGHFTHLKISTLGLKALEAPVIEDICVSLPITLTEMRISELGDATNFIYLASIPKGMGLKVICGVGIEAHWQKAFDDLRDVVNLSQKLVGHYNLLVEEFFKQRIKSRLLMLEYENLKKEHNKFKLDFELLFSVNTTSQQQLYEAKGNINTLKQQYHILSKDRDKAVDLLRYELNEKEKKIIELTQICQKIQSELTSALTNLQGLTQQNQVSHNAEMIVRNHNTELQEKIREKEQALDMLTNEYNVHRAQFEKMNFEFFSYQKSAMSSAEKSEENIKSLTAENAVLNENLRHTLQQSKQLQKTLEETEEKYKKANYEYQGIYLFNQKRLVRDREYEEEKIILNDQIQSLEHNVGVLKEKNQSLQAKLTQIKHPKRKNASSKSKSKSRKKTRFEKESSSDDETKSETETSSTCSLILSLQDNIINKVHDNLGLQEDKKAFKTELTKATRKLTQDHEQTVNALREEILQGVTQLKELSNKHTQSMQEFTEEKLALEKRLSDAQSSNGALKEEKQELGNSIKALNEEILGLKKSNILLNDKADSLKNSNDVLTKKVLRLNDEKVAAEQIIQSLRNELAFSSAISHKFLPSPPVFANTRPAHPIPPLSLTPTATSSIMPANTDRKTITFSSGTLSSHMTLNIFSGLSKSDNSPASKVLDITPSLPHAIN